MKKSKKSQPEDISSDKKPTEQALLTAGDETADDISVQQDDQTKRLSEIESTQVEVASDLEESVDPDKLVTIKRPVAQKVWWKQRIVLIPAGILVVLIILLAVPFTRFVLLGWAWRETVVLTIVDSQTGAPVTDANVVVADKRATTDNAGKAVLPSVALGVQPLRIEKAHYKAVETSVTIDVFSSSFERRQQIEATGRLQSLQIIDRLTGKPIPEATLTDAKGAKLGRTDAKGHATVVIPVNKKEVDVSIAAGKYRVLPAKITLETKVLQLIPDGVVYFLSKQSGKLDVIKTNLDGSDRKVVVAGTGNENEATTTLLASADWRYAVLKAKRAPNKPESLFLLDTVTDTMKLLDEGNASFQIIGWSGHQLLYETRRQDNQYWLPKLTALKSYNADRSNLVTLDENASDPASTAYASLYETLGNYHIIGDRIVYTKVWLNAVLDTLPRDNKQNIIVSTRGDGTDRKVLKSFSPTAVESLHSRAFVPQKITFEIGDRNKPAKYTYGEVEGTTFVSAGQADFSRPYPGYIMSPGGGQSLWREERDGKNVIIIGGKNAEKPEELATKEVLKPYGWLGEDYILVQRKDSELLITTKAQLKAGGELLKISDYHRSQSGAVGNGYGGQ